MKCICDAKKWEYQKGARTTDLLKVLRRENLFPEFADQSFEQLLAVAVYALNLAASKICFLVEAFNASER